MKTGEQADGRIAYIVGMSAFMAIGCIPAKPKAPPKEEKAAIKIKMPKFAPVKQGTETQEREGVVLQMAAPAFKPERSTKATCTLQPSAPFAGMLIINNAEPKHTFEIREEPSLAVNPRETLFIVKVTNRTPQVLKLEGTVFKLNVNGKEIALNQEGYKAFLTGILTPSEEKEFTVVGPEWASLPESATINFALFGMPVSIDQAGNVAKRGNFDWTFKYTVAEETHEDSVKVYSDDLTAGEAQQKCVTMQR